MAEYDIDKLLTVAERVLNRAISAGADVAEACAGEGSHLSAKVRLGKPELVEEAGSRSLGLRVMKNQQVAVTYTSDLSEGGLGRLVEDALELAALAQPDPFAGAPNPDLLSTRDQHVDLDLFDPAIDGLDAATALEMARAGEAAALAQDPRLCNSEGATVGRQSGMSVLATSGGFRGGNTGTYASISVNPIAEEPDGKKRSGSYWSACRHLNDLKTPEQVGSLAAGRTLEKLGARKVKTQDVPVILHPDVARSIIGLLAGCVTGGAVWRKSSYLATRLGEAVASSLVTLIDDPLIPRAPGSRAFDGEGLLCRRQTVVEKGVLKTFLLDSYGARKMNSESSASASRGSSGGVGASTSNFLLQPGTQSPEELLASTERALYVTSMMGFGFAAITGDFSRGAAGFWIEGGKRVHAVEEVTISSNLATMLKGIDAIADDLDMRTSTASPTIRIASMTLAGS